MSFQTALSGLNAASGNLNVTGHNIANASTTGFKQSRADFADVYAVSFGGVSKTAAGSGVRMAAVTQQFSQAISTLPRIIWILRSVAMVFSWSVTMDPYFIPVRATSRWTAKAI
ncbi:MAG: flagellar basal body protein [Thiohalomonadaceae bacterium]